MQIFMYLDKVLKRYVRYLAPMEDIGYVKDLYISKDAFKGGRFPESILVKIEVL